MTEIVGRSRTVPALLLFSLGPVVVQALFTVGEIIPYVGSLFQTLRPILAFFIFLAIGWHASELSKALAPAVRALFLSYALAVCSMPANSTK